MEILVSTEKLKDIHQIAIYIPSGGTRRPVTCSNHLLLKSALWNSGKPRRLKSFSLQTRDRGYRGTFHRFCLVSIPLYFNTPWPEGNRSGTRKGIKFWIESNHKLGKRTQI